MRECLLLSKDPKFSSPLQAKAFLTFEFITGEDFQSRWTLIKQGKIRLKLTGEFSRGLSRLAQDGSVVQCITLAETYYREQEQLRENHYYLIPLYFLCSEWNWKGGIILWSEPSFCEHSE